MASRGVSRLEITLVFGTRQSFSAKKYTVLSCAHQPSRLQGIPLSPVGFSQKAKQVHSEGKLYVCVYLCALFWTHIFVCMSSQMFVGVCMCAYVYSCLPFRLYLCLFCDFDLDIHSACQESTALVLSLKKLERYAEVQVTKPDVHPGLTSKKARDSWGFESGALWRAFFPPSQSGLSFRQPVYNVHHRPLGQSKRELRFC